MLLMLAVVIFADDEWLCPLLSLQQPCSAMLQHSAVSGRRRRESLRVDSNYVQSLDQPSPTLAMWWCEALLDVNMLDNLLRVGCSVQYLERLLVVTAARQPRLGPRKKCVSCRSRWRHCRPSRQRRLSRLALWRTARL